jgi:hypothetical protein
MDSGKSSAIMQMTGQVRQDGGNYPKLVIRTPPSHQNRRCRVAGENNPSENGAFRYDFVRFEDYLGNVELRESKVVTESKIGRIGAESQPDWPDKPVAPQGVPNSLLVQFNGWPLGRGFDHFLVFCTP